VLVTRPKTPIEYFRYDGRVVGRKRYMPYPASYALYLGGWIERPLMDWDTNADPLTEDDAMEWIVESTFK
jgi:hypothetical protein